MFWGSATQTLGQPQTLRAHASPGAATDTWQLDEEPPRGDTDATGTPLELFTHGSQQCGEKRFAKGSLQICCLCPCSSGLLWERQPQKPQASPMDQEQALSSIISSSCQVNRGWKDLVQSNNFANQDTLIRGVSTSEQAVPVLLGGSDANPDSGPYI